ncbi:hypothetical protein [Commensalibacter intestini]|nr:hypothetical protein [Commensalibacter intestini]
MNNIINENKDKQDNPQTNNSANSSAQSTPADPNQQPDPDIMIRIKNPKN